MSMLIGQAQTGNLLASATTLESKTLVILYTGKATIEKINALNSSTNKESASDNFLLAKEYDESVLEEFGSYMNPYNNYLKVVSPKGVIYTKAQVMDISTGVTVLKKKLKDGKISIDLSDASPGAYILILTDAGRNIHSEEFSIY